VNDIRFSFRTFDILQESNTLFDYENGQSWVSWMFFLSIPVSITTMIGIFALCGNPENVLVIILPLGSILAISWVVVLGALMGTRHVVVDGVARVMMVTTTFLHIAYKREIPFSRIQKIETGIEAVYVYLDAGKRQITIFQQGGGVDDLSCKMGVERVLWGNK
jgi:hypothetical protein